jgi:hypothetical protein
MLVSESSPQRFVVLLVLCLASAIKSSSAAEVRLENEFITRTVVVDKGRLRTTRLANKLDRQELKLAGAEEFRVRLSADVNSTQPDVMLTAADFEVTSSDATADAIRIELCNKTHGVSVAVCYTLRPGKKYGHKHLEIVSDEERTLELVDIESLVIAEAFSPYKAKDMMRAYGRFLPALGQPLYTNRTATFWGVEFPAAWNRLEGETLRCGVQYGDRLQPGRKFTTHRAVFGVGDDPEFVQEAFLEYIDEIRASPAKLSVQYNSWFDFGGGITQKKLQQSLDTLHQELVDKRGCRPLDAYVIDDGWQNSRPPRSPLADWSKGLYPVNQANFDADLQSARAAIEAKGSHMGLWASPACLFGATANLEVLEQNGFEVLVGENHPKSGLAKKAMSMAGPKYLALLEKRLLEMVDMGSVYFKLDGIFGDMQSRLFETVPHRGTPVMTSLLPPDGMLANDPRIDDPKFDEMKRYYITVATQRLAAIFDKMHSKNPRVRIMCHNGATISPWWLMHLDVLSLVNCNDGAPGDRTLQMCYRDGLYYQLTRRDGNQVPLNSFFNHEPAKDGNRFDDASPEAFKNYLFLALSRGTLTVELYFVVNSLDAKDFDVVADGLKWLDLAAPAFQRARMHGGSPIGATSVDEGQLSLKRFQPAVDGEVYGYTGWTQTQGYVSIHNPSQTAKPYSFTLDRRFGLLPNSGPFQLRVTHGESAKELKKDWKFGEIVTLNVQPQQVIVLDFQRSKSREK